LELAEKTALERAPRVQRAVASRETAYAYRTYGQLPRAGNPQVNLRAMIGRPDAPAATYSVMLGIPFDVMGKRRAWRNEASFITEEADARLLAVQNEVRAEARVAYVEVALAIAARTVAEQSADTARELLERVQARLDANAATALDVALSESQYAEAAADLARAQRTLVEAQNAFRQALDLSHDTDIRVSALSGPTLPAGLTIENAVVRARDKRMEAAAWASASRRWRSADRRLRAEAMAPVTAALEGEAQGNNNTQKSVGAGVNFELPFVMTNQAERAVARGEASAAAVEHELASHGIDRDASSSYRRLEAALAELAAIEERALPAAERTLQMVHTMLDAGVVDYFRLLAARSSAFQLRSRRVEALREAWLCRIALERAMGGWKETP
jgi:outer membrane protein TolC